MKVKILAKQRLEAAKKRRAKKFKKEELTPWLKKVIQEGEKNRKSGNYVEFTSYEDALKYALED